MNKKSQLEDELNVIQSQLKDLNNLKNQYEKLELNTDSFFMKRSKGEQNEQEAIRKIKEKYQNQDIILDESNHVSTEFDILEKVKKNN